MILHGNEAYSDLLFHFALQHNLQERKTIAVALETGHVKRPHLGSQTSMTKTNIISAILNSKGPAVTHRVMNSGYSFLKMLTAKQFQSIAKEVETYGLGQFVAVQTGSSRPSMVLIKAPPDEARPILEANLHLCSPDHYSMRYKQPMSKIINESVRRRLIATGLVPL